MNENDILQLGDQGELVTKLQEALIKILFLQGMPDGYFGIDTLTAVRNFQKARGIPLTGIVDYLTWHEIMLAKDIEVPSSLPTLRVGSTGNDVKTLQFRLSALGYLNDVADGVFGNKTLEAVKDFQKARGLVVDGIVGPATWRAIINLFAGVYTPVPKLRQTIQLNDQGAEVLLLQNMLAALGYPIYDTPGIFNEQVKEQVMAFQKDFGIDENGVVGPRTWSQLIALIAPPYITEPLLKKGMAGDEVTVMQTKLQILGYHPYTVTGSFDEQTEKEVIQFQKNNDLIPSGIVDKVTWNVLDAATLITTPLVAGVLGRPTLRLGDSGEYVRELQRDLYTLGFYTGAINGVFNTQTQTAVKAFQTNNKLTADGIVGRDTWSALIYIYAPLAACNPDGQIPPDDVLTQGIVIDPGHGGNDPGTSGHGVIEKDFVLKISQYMYNRLREMGIPVAMTRFSDQTLTPEQRIAAITAPYGDSKGVVVLSNHLNNSGGEGAETIYALRSQPTLARSILQELEKEGQVTRRYFQRRFPEDESLDYYYIMRETQNVEPVIIEYAFLDSSNDVIRLQKYWQNWAEAALRATLTYKGMSYTPPESGKIVYVVRAGDTLFSIARNFNTTVDEIKRVNNLTSNTITVGQQLIIPGSTDSTTPPSGNLVYIVKAGDTLSSIAAKFNTTVAEIKRYNNLTSDLLQIGQSLYIPGISVTVPGTETEVYTVVAGDNLYSIALRFNTTVDELRRLNSLTSDTLTVGQRLLVPRLTQQTFTYTVVSGDTLSSIARRFNTTVAEIKRLNNLTSDFLTVGQQLIIPGPQVLTHTVVSGDSLWALARRYNTTVQELKNINNLTSDSLSIGQVLLIPFSPSVRLYQVNEGENLDNIARHNDISVEQLRQMNALRSDKLIAGQQLIIQPSTQPFEYVIKGGDSLWSIAQMFNTTVNAIKQANHLDSNIIFIGARLIIPQ